MRKEKVMEMLEELWLKGLTIFGGSFLVVIMVGFIMNTVKEIF